MTIKKQRLKEFEEATHILRMDAENYLGFEIQDGAGIPIGKVVGIVYTSPEAVRAMLDELISYLKQIRASWLCIAYRMENQDELIPVLTALGFNGEWHLASSVYLEKDLREEANEDE